MALQYLPPLPPPYGPRAGLVVASFVRSLRLQHNHPAGERLRSSPGEKIRAPKTRRVEPCVWIRSGYAVQQV